MTKNILKSLIVTSAIYLLAIVIAPTTYAISAEEREAAKEERVTQREEAMEERTAERDAAKEERDAEREEESEERRIERCEKVKERVAARVAKMEDNKAVHLANYSRLIDRMTEVIAKLNEQGLDVSAVEADLATLEGMVAEYETLYATFLASLEDYEASTCEEFEGGFRGVLGAAKEHLKALIEARKEIREFYRTEIRADIKDLRDQAKELRGDAEDVDTDEDTDDGEDSDADEEEGTDE